MVEQVSLFGVKPGDIFRYDDEDWIIDSVITGHSEGKRQFVMIRFLEPDREGNLDGMATAQMEYGFVEETEREIDAAEGPVSDRAPIKGYEPVEDAFTQEVGPQWPNRK